ncbi:MAG: methyltransferase domain-containing protein [Deltaproteobacteria bacterium]|nr:MAG: methyltransferase domain-containing protein [Deltaproteobacteria bacterium]
MAGERDPELLTLAEALANDPRPTLVWGERTAPLRELLPAGYPVRFFTDDLATSRELGCPLGVVPERGDETRVALVMPRAKALLELRVALASALLPPEGELWVAGHQQDGVKSAETVLEAAGAPGTTHVVHLKRRCRVLATTLDAARPADEPGLGRFEERVPVKTGAGGYEVVTLPGVFGHGRLDAATAALLSVLDARAPGYRRALDAGCGAGVLGAWLATKRPRAQVDLLDVSAIACAAAQRTFEVNGLSGEVHLRELEDLPKASWDLVVSNPPRHTGRDHAHELTARIIDAAAWRLGRGGRFICVANHAKSVTDALERNFRKVEVAHHAPAFRVWDCER